VFTFRPNEGNTARTAGRDPHCENLAASEAEAGDQVERVSRFPRRPPTDRRGGRTYVWGYGEPVADLPIPELIENRRRSIAMLAPGAPALNRDEALEVLAQLRDALHELRGLRRQLG
jgi:hypothetical protein